MIADAGLGNDMLVTVLLVVLILAAFVWIVGHVRR